MQVLSRLMTRLNVPENKQRIFRNLYWALLGKVVSLLSGLLVGIIVARYLGEEQYGLMNYVISYVTIFQVLACFGIDNIEIREETRTPDLRDRIIGTALAIKLAMALVTFIIIVVMVQRSEGDSYTRWLIILYALSVFFNTLSVARNHFTALVWNEYVVKTEISRTVIGVIFKIILLLCHASLTWFVFVTMFDAVLLASGYAWSYHAKIAKIRLWRFDRSVAQMLLVQGFPLLLSGAAVVIYQRIDQVMIGQMIDKASVGFFSVAARFVEIIIFVPVILSQTVTPILVKIREQDKDRYAHQSQLFMNVSLWLSIVLCVLTCLVARPLIRYTFGPQYMAAVPVLQVLVFKVVGMTLSQVSGQMIIIERIQQWAVVRNIVGCAVCVSLNYLLIPHYGIMGSAVVTIITMVVSGWFVHLLIPPYRKYFFIQSRALFFGWKDLLHTRSLLTHT